MFTDSESFQDFQTEILKNHLLPHLQSGNLKIQSGAVESLSKFPVDIIMGILGPIHNYAFTGKDIKLLERLITAESQSMRRGLFKGNQAADIGDSSDEQKRLMAFKRSILNSVRDELNTGRIKTTRKTALCFLSIIEPPFTKVGNLLALKDMAAIIKNMNLDSIWQLIHINEYLEFFWHNYLGKFYDELEIKNHSEKVNEIETIISSTYSLALEELLPNSSSPQMTSNILFCLACTSFLE